MKVPPDKSGYIFFRYCIFMYHSCDKQLYRTNLKYQMPVVCIEGPLNLAHCNARYHILDTGMHLE